MFWQEFYIFFAWDCWPGMFHDMVCMKGTAVVEREILGLREISYTYPDGQKALDGVSLSIKPGEKIAVLGNNGAGKTTFFLVCNGVLIPQHGEVCYLGRLVSGKRRELMELKSHVGIVFQEPDHQLIASTVESEVSFGPLNMGLSRENVSRCVDTALLSMDLVSYKHRAPHYLSGGEKKRVTIADILAMNPDVILMDEPEASLDARNTALLEETMKKLSCEGIALAISTHDVDFAYRFADRAVVFHQGRVIADDDILTVFGQEKVLETAGLRQPVLYQMANLFKDSHKELEQFPRTMEEAKKQFAY